MASKTKFSPLAAVIIAVGIIAIFAYFFGLNPKSQITPSEDTSSSEETRTPSGSFEFRGPGYVEVEDPREANIIIVKAPGAKDARPITVTAKADGKVVSEEVISADEPNCGDENTCSLPVPDSWQGIYDSEGYEILATDAAGNLLALFANLGR